ADTGHVSLLSRYPCECATVVLVDSRIGLVDHADVVMALDPLLHHTAQPHSPLRIAEQRGDCTCGLSRRRYVREDAALAKCRLLVAAAEQNLTARTDIRCHGRNAGSAGFEHAQRLRFAETCQHIYVDVREICGHVNPAGEFDDLSEIELRDDLPAFVDIALLLLGRSQDQVAQLAALQAEAMK